MKGILVVYLSMFLIRDLKWDVSLARMDENVLQGYMEHSRLG